MLHQQKKTIFLNTVVLCLTLSYHALASQYLKPDFVPYCTTRDRCRPDCSCELAEDCEIMELDDTARKMILDYHNQLRDLQSSGEPVPGGMTFLQYDYNLEEISKCWAAKCGNSYSECFTTPEFNETSQAVGQTPKVESEKTFDVVYKIMRTWIGQPVKISAETLSDFPAGEEGENIHDFAQLLSDRILKVGCAWSFLKDSITFVCSYGPRGPMQGEPIYKIGPLCSLCPQGYACDHEAPFTSLCKETLKSVLTTPPAPPPLPAVPNVTPPQPPPRVPNPPTKPPFTTPPKPPPTQTEQSCPPHFLPPPSMPQVPPIPPPRRPHISPPPVPPRVPPKNTHPIYSNEDPPIFAPRMPPYLPQTDASPCGYRSSMAESSFELIQLPGGVFDSPPHSPTYSEYDYSPQPAPLHVAVPTPPPRARSFQNPPHEPLSLPSPFPPPLRMPQLPQYSPNNGDLFRKPRPTSYPPNNPPRFSPFQDFNI